MPSVGTKDGYLEIMGVAGTNSASLLEDEEKKRKEEKKKEEKTTTTKRWSKRER